jgi:hypothetical protein
MEYSESKDFYHVVDEDGEGWMLRKDPDWMMEVI